MSPRSARGSARIHLVLVVAFALFAMFTLTRTWFSARHIAGDLDQADHRLDAIHQNTAQIGLLSQTTDLTAAIAGQTHGLSGQGRRLSRTVDDIAVNSESIRHQVGPIHQRVSDIDGHVTDIHSTVGRLLGTVTGIQHTANGIEGHAGSIQDRFVSELGVAHHIAGRAYPDPVGIDSINHNAAAVIRITHHIHADLGSVRHSVIAVQHHARSIDRSFATMDPVNPPAGICSLDGIGKLLRAC